MENLETWRDVPGYEGLYQVSDLGRVKRVAGTTTRVVRDKVITQPIVERVLKPATSKSGGYHVVGLCKDGETKHTYVHRLVAEAYIGPFIDGMHVCHNDGEPTKNTPTNLRYDTPTGNGSDRAMHGTDAIGSKNPMAIIDEEGAAWIKRRLESHSVKEVTEMTGLSRQAISCIKNGRNWRHVDPDDYLV